MQRDPELKLRLPVFLLITYLSSSSLDLSRGAAKCGSRPRHVVSWTVWEGARRNHTAEGTTWQNTHHLTRSVCAGIHHRHRPHPPDDRRLVCPSSRVPSGTTTRSSRVPRGCRTLRRASCPSKGVKPLKKYFVLPGCPRCTPTRQPTVAARRAPNYSHFRHGRFHTRTSHRHPHFQFQLRLLFSILPSRME